MILSPLTLRILSALVLAPLVLGAVWFGGIVYVLFIVVMALAGFYEWEKMTAPTALPNKERRALYAGLVGVLLGAVLGSAKLGLGLLLLFWLVAYLTAKRKGPAFWLSLGIPYLGISALALIFLRTETELGFANILNLLFTVWGTDIGAYAAGCTIGGPKIWPQISPKKTWAGLFGGMALAVVLSYGAKVLCDQPFSGFDAGFAALLAIVAQAGDFFESFVKRKYGVKDSGNLIPGHGGVLDRIDGLLFAAVFMALVLG